MDPKKKISSLILEVKTISVHENIAIISTCSCLEHFEIENKASFRVKRHSFILFTNKWKSTQSLYTSGLYCKSEMYVKYNRWLQGCSDIFPNSRPAWISLTEKVGLRKNVLQNVVFHQEGGGLSGFKCCILAKLLETCQDIFLFIKRFNILHHTRRD